ncbi:MAG TPA: HAD family phosphatase, partial [Terriglobales bacterium]|nr:HAD family phosphatase [Terriglobales bacterium]
ETGVQVSSQQLSSLRQWDVEMWSNLNPAMISWIQALKSAGIRTALLSNMQLDMAKKVRAEFSWIKELHTAVLSYELRLAKPEAGIYEHCLRGLGTSPEETLFIDDREVNVEGARKVGLQAIRFESPDQLRKELAVLNFAPLPS